VCFEGLLQKEVISKKKALFSISYISTLPVVYRRELSKRFVTALSIKPVFCGLIGLWNYF
jgi:hypothetical protein